MQMALYPGFSSPILASCEDLNVPRVYYLTRHALSQFVKRLAAPIPAKWTFSFNSDTGGTIGFTREVNREPGDTAHIQDRRMSHVVDLQKLISAVRLLLVN